ncbi:Prephenate dehydratase [Aminomonas paucivorans DSM 12260]|uniref:Bifunctional chorismate mutase/prephenate dehydratase n=1 Tax=Aminomonas paucivorans DSM 12260 TaxID=584708 RepID=E3CV84_9BACT|nr:prephenate dehydratase [Aminomonas paucivorans]EFQ24171.1 Prephenate dehydratase [Aminomonas paucivorans DSM 12260]
MDEVRLRALRERIDELDEALAVLLERRAETAREIGAAKGDGPTYDPAREARILRNLQARHPDLDPEALGAVHREVISLCRGVQRHLSAACLGPEGSFSHAAALRALGHGTNLALQPDLPSVFRALEEGSAALGVVPVENTLEGTVLPTLDAFSRAAPEVRVLRELRLPVRHVLASREPALDRIREVHSHPQALAQCRLWLAGHLPGTPQIPEASTSGAAERAARTPGTACLCSREAAGLRGLTVLARDVQDHPHNATRFWVLGTGQAPEGNPRKTSLLFTVPHRPGTLLDALDPLREAGLNLTLIQSRPLPENPFEYFFCVDFQGPAEAPEAARALEAMEARCFRLRILGSYPVES